MPTGGTKNSCAGVALGREGAGGVASGDHDGKNRPTYGFFSSSRMKALQEREDAVVHAALPPRGVYTSLSATSEGCVAEESDGRASGSGIT
jgi:hypothetical protein